MQAANAFGRCKSFVGNLKVLLEALWMGRDPVATAWQRFATGCTLCGGPLALSSPIREHSFAQNVASLQVPQSGVGTICKRVCKLLAGCGQLRCHCNDLAI
ncbi:unnamed protein product [Ostreobium quekettii]|uniref:Uncharacterized protein n=1 Tax=Ostreobium quekettii TaxID=121088 RepID=A0A8S1J876_9CHLO|nr:unnamed protein product [Ostreobium quekettii]